MTPDESPDTTEDAHHELVFGLVDIFRECAEPHAVAANLMSGLLISAGELGQEMGRVLNDMESLARLEGQPLPMQDLTAARHELQTMPRLRQDLELDRLFSARTRRHCGLPAVPLLALALVRVWLRVSYADRWLESKSELALRIDTRLHLLRHSYR